MDIQTITTCVACGATFITAMANLIYTSNSKKNEFNNLYLHFVENKDYMELINKIGEKHTDNSRVFTIIRENKGEIETILSYIELLLAQFKHSKIYKAALEQMVLIPMASSEAVFTMIRLLKEREGRFGNLYKSLFILRGEQNENK